jgi:protease YdgD
MGMASNRPAGDLGDAAEAEWGSLLLLGLKSTAVLICALAMTVSAGAQPPQAAQPGLAQGDVIGAKDYPWSAIGKLNNGVGGSCTAVLVSEKYALTAAHCLIFRSSGRYLPAESLHLVLGYEKQDFREHFHVAAYYVPPAHQPQRPYETLANDWALLSLSPTGPARVRPLDIAAEDDIHGLNLMTAGYSHRIPYAMTADQSCRVVGQSHDHNFVFDTCKAPSGYSGSPVIVASPKKRGFAVAALHVANQLWQTNTIAVAIPMRTIWPKIRSCVEGGKCGFQVVAHGQDPTAAELLSGRAKTYQDVRPAASAECMTDQNTCLTSLTAQP